MAESEADVALRRQGAAATAAASAARIDAVLVEAYAHDRGSTDDDFGAGSAPNATPHSLIGAVVIVVIIVAAPRPGDPRRMVRISLLSQTVMLVRSGKQLPANQAMFRVPVRPAFDGFVVHGRFVRIG